MITEKYARDVETSEGDILPSDDYFGVVVEESESGRDAWIETQADVSGDTEGQGIAVSLIDRAVALEAIMKFYNKRNMTRGSEQQAAIDGSAFRARYKNPESVQRGAERNTRMLFQAFMKGIDTLAAVDQHRAAGMSEDDITLEKVFMKRELNEEFLDGNADANKRAHALKQAKKAAEL